MTDQLKFRTEAIMLLLENGFDTQRVVEENPYGATKAIKDAFLVICDQADRIEELVKERDGNLAERNKFQLYLQRTHADWELEVAAVDALNAKLAKAGTVTLETILNERGPVFDAMVDAAEDAAGKDVSFNVVVGRAIRAALAVLAELEGKE